MQAQCSHWYLVLIGYAPTVFPSHSSSAFPSLGSLYTNRGRAQIQVDTVPQLVGVYFTLYIQSFSYIPHSTGFSIIFNVLYLKISDYATNSVIYLCCSSLLFPGLIQREGGSMEQEMGELRRYRTQSISRGEFALSDSFYFYRKGLESIVDDQVTQRFSSEELVSWNLLTRTNHNFHYISLRLTVIWGLGVIIRYCVLFPLRITLAIIGISWLVIGTTLVGFLPNRRNNKPQKGGICVANHTSPIDIVILANDGCYAMVGQSHSGLMGVIQRSMVRSCPHVWFERSEMRDRHAVTSRLRAHVAAKRNLPILIFPEGTCINNTSVMMFKKGSFEIGGTIYPVAIKYDPRFGDAFWNSAKYNMVSYLLRMMTSWAIVVNVWYLPPMTRQEGEDATKFANRVKSAIAHQGGLLDMAWDGSLKRDKVKEEFKEHQQKMYSSMVVGKKARNSQEPHTESSKS
uniref:Glycerol-3-phosphate acyltransferase 3 n=1 Tax=Oncorhynchus tshawytscha TaxID=74940 RepID=A0AAZ3Q3U7_ONCTS